MLAWKHIRLLGAAIVVPAPRPPIMLTGLIRDLNEVLERFLCRLGLARATLTADDQRLIFTLLEASHGLSRDRVNMRRRVESTRVLLGLDLIDDLFAVKTGDQLERVQSDEDLAQVRVDIALDETTSENLTVAATGTTVVVQA